MPVRSGEYEVRSTFDSGCVLGRSDRRSVPTAAVSNRSKQRLLDHLVGAAKHCNRKRQTEQLRGPHIDDQLDFCGLGDWKLCRLFALENLRRIDSELAVNVCKAGPVAEQA